MEDQPVQHPEQPKEPNEPKTSGIVFERSSFTPPMWEAIVGLQAAGRDYRRFEASTSPLTHKSYEEAITEI